MGLSFEDTLKWTGYLLGFNFLLALIVPTYKVGVGSTGSGVSPAVIFLLVILLAYALLRYYARLQKLASRLFH